ncbi:Hypothetical protein FORC18_2917 [Vibrio parahaemolyticus]|nr:hypothetical protein FORC8_2910 [Vibrio parahaemolyticus]APE85530.1 Hypothetical protein FORC18_2917 [Vibrio parahaemolyticus]TON00710.1 hypothetical protein CGH66_03185 [Vibrio parahaemolyticus]TON02203.1 hypothetical protein CGH67_21990 [Vibrio parahaemolyticus]TON36552.1 hypothetical protein CGH59_00980 [Vibrio parahaemolyticus]
MPLSTFGTMKYSIGKQDIVSFMIMLPLIQIIMQSWRPRTKIDVILIVWLIWQQLKVKRDEITLA